MNPFTQDPVAAPRPEPRRFVARLPGAAPRPARRLLARTMGRTMGRLAMVGGLGLAALPAQALDVNSASAEQLESVRGLGPRMAQTIVQERTRGGRFESLEDLSDRVRGIGPKRAQALQAAGLAVGAAEQAGGAAAAMPRSAVATPSIQVLHPPSRK